MQKEFYLRDVRPTMNHANMIMMRTLYESYTPENTHLMREYMLYVVIKNVRHMKKHKLITNAIFQKFELLDTLQPPSHQSKELKQFLS